LPAAERTAPLPITLTNEQLARLRGWLLDQVSADLGPNGHSAREDLRPKVASRLEQAYEADPDEFQRRNLLKLWSHLCIVVDDYDKMFAQIDAERRSLQECLSRGGELGISFLIAGHVPSLPADFDDSFMMRIRRHGCGVLLGGTDGLEQFNNARRPPGVAGSGMPAGRGMMVRQGTARLFQAAAYWQQGEDPDEALTRRVHRIVAQPEATRAAG